MKKSFRGLTLDRTSWLGRAKSKFAWPKRIEGYYFYLHAEIHEHIDDYWTTTLLLGLRNQFRKFRDKQGSRGSPISKYKIQKLNGREENKPRFLIQVMQYAETKDVTWFWNRIHYPIYKWCRGLCGVITKPIMWWGLTQTWTYCGKSRAIDRGPKESPSSSQESLESEQIEIVIRGLKNHLNQALTGNPGITSLKQLRTTAQWVERLLPKVRKVYELEDSEGETEEPKVAAIVTPGDGE